MIYFIIQKRKESGWIDVNKVSQKKWITQKTKGNTAQKNEVVHSVFIHWIWPNPQFSADLATFTEKILNGKLYFLSSKHHQTSESKTGAILYSSANKFVTQSKNQNDSNAVELPFQIQCYPDSPPATFVAALVTYCPVNTSTLWQC